MICQRPLRSSSGDRVFRLHWARTRDELDLRLCASAEPAFGGLNEILATVWHMHRPQV
jgi:hypothetical protein